jgi:hypothetical protein
MLNNIPPFDFEQFHKQFEGQFTHVIHIGPWVFGEIETPPAPLAPPPSNGPAREAFLVEIQSSLETLTVAQARERFTFWLPAWVPEGFGLKDEVRFPKPPEQLPANVPPGVTFIMPAMLTLRWAHADEKRWLTLTLNEAPPPSEFNFPRAVPPGGAKEVRVHQQTAALVTQSWMHYVETENGVDEMRASHQLELMWHQGQWHYHFFASEGALTEAELLRVAESVA